MDLDDVPEDGPSVDVQDEQDMDTVERDQESSEESSAEEEPEDDGDADNKTGDSQAYVPGSEKLEDGEELVMDESAYVVYHQATLGPPCLSFDVLPTDNAEETAFPLSIYGVAGSQATKANQNSIIAFKMHNVHPIKKRKEGEENEDADDEEDEEEEEEEDPEKQPKLKVASIKHTGAINRIKCNTLGSTTVAAAWAETGSVAIWNLNPILEKLEQPQTGKEPPREKSVPLFNFQGHLTEGYALAWSPMTPGVLASGDCRKNIHLWTPSAGGSWSVNQSPLSSHAASVEDIQWSPNESNVLASCSVDKSIKIWDCRARPDKACMLTVGDAHDSDINVIDWNRYEPFIVSGGDDGVMKIWDLRQFASGQPVAMFKHHSGPITSVEWHPTERTVLASSGADDQIALWDLAIERDAEEEQELAPELKNLPPQLLFIHQGLQEIKEIHWHKKIPGLMLSTSQSGFDVFRTISV